MKEAPSTLPTPLPLPPPPLETTAVHLPMRRRVRQKAATSPAITSSQSSLSSSPTNSSSSGSSSSSIPFSWEHQPGIPKTPNASETLSLPLPLPPSRHGMGIVVTPRSGSGSGSGSGTPLKPVSDPFVTALPECAKEGFEKCGKVGTGTASHVQRRLIKAGRPLSVPAITGRFALLDLYGCKTAISVVDAAVSLPQAARRVGTYRVVSRQKPRTDRRRADQNQKASV